MAKESVKKLTMVRDQKSLCAMSCLCAADLLRDDYLMFPKKGWPSLTGFKRFLKVRYPYMVGTKFWKDWIENMQFKKF